MAVMEKQGITPATFKIYCVSGSSFPFYFLSSCFLKGRTTGHIFMMPFRGVARGGPGVPVTPPL